MNIRRLLSITAIAIMPGFISCLKCDPCETNVLNNTDKENMIGLYVASTTGIMPGDLAIKEAENPAIRSYSDYVVQSHYSIRDELQTLASNIGFVLPYEATDARQQFAGFAKPQL